MEKNRDAREDKHYVENTNCITNELTGTTVLTSPIFSASAAVYNLAKNHISRAFLGPTCEPKIKPCPNQEK